MNSIGEMETGEEVDGRVSTIEAESVELELLSVVHEFDLVVSLVGLEDEGE